jgi:hypothetical protein
MQHLLQPRVLNLAAGAALVSALASYPRFALWQHRPGPVWFSLAIIFFCSIMLWAFVFAWHEPYTKRPIFIFKPELVPFAVATLTGIGAAAVYYFWLDPPLRSKLPEDYPPDLRHWLATLLFILCFNQLFSTFAPFDWLMRLARNRWIAMALTALFGAGVQAMKIHSLAVPMSPLLLTMLLALRIVGGCLVVAFYLRGGVFLVWWWTFLLESRLLFSLSGDS